MTGPDSTEPTAPASSRSAKRQLTFVSLAGALAIVGALAAGYYFAMRPVMLRVAVGPANSDDLKVVQTLAQAFSHQTNSQIRLRLAPTEGAAASAQALADGKADLAIIRGDLDVPKNAQAVATLRKNVAVLWVPPPLKVKGKKAAAKITKVAQLTGHRIGVVGRTQANVNLLKVILQQYGVDPARVEIVQFPANEAVEAIRNQKADAYLAAGPVNSKITTEAIAASTRDGGNPNFLAIDLAEAIAQNHPTYEASDIPAGSFGNDRPEDEIKTISFAHHIVARKGLSESTVAAFTRQLFAIRQSLKNEFPLAAKIETPDTDKDATIPVHPGAAAFVDGEEKTFLDRYSDYIWWSLMALSAMGSAGAWFAGYLKKDERNTNSTQRDRLLDMLHAARACDSTDELDRMQAEADDILRDTLQCFEHGAIEQGTLTAFNIALEQFHNAVADRKALLMSMPQSLQRAGAQFRAASTA
ncbi:MAG TPA: TAXI family TRAP transporter solute-binding subunit [Bradyrhizobium sp.]|nr:TAXI family TRAP transporter solute-binding subunit [Bradyrhizobium sp.]